MHGTRDACRHHGSSQTAGTSEQLRIVLARDVGPVPSMSPAGERWDSPRDKCFPFDDKNLSFSDNNSYHEHIARSYCCELLLDSAFPGLLRRKGIHELHGKCFLVGVAG